MASVLLQWQPCLWGDLTEDRYTCTNGSRFCATCPCAGLTPKGQKPHHQIVTVKRYAYGQRGIEFGKYKGLLLFDNLRSTLRDADVADEVLNEIIRTKFLLSSSNKKDGQGLGTALENFTGRRELLKAAYTADVVLNEPESSKGKMMSTECSLTSSNKKDGQGMKTVVRNDRRERHSLASLLQGPISLSEGKRIHAYIIRSGLMKDVFLAKLLVNMYGKCGALEAARSVFDKIDRRDVVSWNIMISANARHGHSKEALRLFRRMQQEGVKPNRITFVSVLSACASRLAIAAGREIHGCILDGGLESDVVVGNALITMYGKCEALDDARSIFNRMHQRNVISWTTMIAAYSQHGHGKEALHLFQQMQHEGVQPNQVTFVSVLNACASLSDLVEGQAIHACIVDGGFEADIIVGTALVDMYGKCGALKEACGVFDRMQRRNVVAWTAMMAAYAQHGHGKEVLQLFRQMEQEGVKPDEITFVTLLSACSHAGLVDECLCYFVCMNKDYGITPTLEHYKCMIDLFGRAGQLDEAEDFIYNMPLKPDAVVWMTLLGACRVHGDVERGNHAAEHVIDLDPQNAVPYVLLSNIYAAYEKWDEREKLRKATGKMGCKKAARVQVV